MYCVQGKYCSFARSCCTKSSKHIKGYERQSRETECVQRAHIREIITATTAALAAAIVSLLFQI